MYLRLCDFVQFSHNVNRGPDADLKVRRDTNLILNKTADFPLPVGKSSGTLLASERVGPAFDVVLQAGEVERTEAVGIVVEGTAKHVGHGETGDDRVFAKGPGKGVTNIDIVFCVELSA